MKKSTFLKLAFIVVATFSFTGSFAQGLETDYLLIGAGNSYVTVGKSIPVYVEPDALYHPTWAFPSTNLTAGFTWDFTLPGGGVITINQPSTLNYAEFTGVTVGGPYVVNVKEVADAAFGGCSDAGRDFNINVLPVPTAGIVGAAVDADWSVTTPNYSYYRCGNLLGGENLTVTITEAGALAAFASYAYSIEKRTVNINVSNVEDAASIVVTSNFVTHPTTAKLAGVNDGGTEVVTTGALSVLNNLRTKYTFTLKKALNLPVATAAGIVSAISQKSDYVYAMNHALTVLTPGDNTFSLDEITTYPFTGTVVVQYIVNPSPTTGPIYHIPNTFSF